MTRQDNDIPRIPADCILSLKITLRGIEPPIWRRLEVRASTDLSKLHMTFQDALGWTNSHLHSFYIDGKEYGYEDEDGELDTIDEKGVKLYKLFSVTTPGFWYLYDFGDHWQHDVQIEGILPAKQGVKYPRCVDGARKCPPEDCGSTGGYKRMLEVIRNPKDEEYDSMVVWLGGRYDPEEFDLARVNRKLKRTKAEPEYLGDCM
jgi:hypothetical protein